MDSKLLDILVCPICKGKLTLHKTAEKQELICKIDRLAFQINDDIPVMLQEEARTLDIEDPLLK